ncbi:MAG TPA: hypothetical protein VM733_04600, partial [Thermoanaerobaculia bacterium]|nr:hypothetical protein [Thermoanaerobaculia bacterium]
MPSLDRWTKYLLIAALAIAPMAAAQTINVRAVADNHLAGYTGTVTTANTMQFSRSFGNGALIAPGFTTTDPFLYVAAWDDGSVFQGFLASVGIGTGFVTTGSPLWQVCATGLPLADSLTAAPTTAALSAAIVTCNNSNGWHAPSVGPNNGNASANKVNNINLWGPVNAIDLTAAWIWNTNSSTACSSGQYGFLAGACNPGEYLIFRLPLKEAAGCDGPIPDFVIDWNAGFGTLVANGTNSQYEQNYFWSIEESDASWNRYPPEVTRWFAGQAAAFDLKPFYETGSGK